MANPTLFLGGLEWKLPADADWNGLKENLKNAMKTGETSRVQLANRQELVVHGARLDYFMVWDDSMGEAPSVGSPSGMPKSY
jgi:hypothetical protein